MKNKKTIVIASIFVFMLVVGGILLSHNSVRADDKVSISMLEKELKKVDEDFDKKLAGLEKRIEELETIKTELESNIKTQNETISKQDNQIKELQEKVKEAASDVEKISKRTSLMEKRDNYFYKFVSTNSITNATVIAAQNTLKIVE